MEKKRDGKKNERKNIKMRIKDKNGNKSTKCGIKRREQKNRKTVKGDRVKRNNTREKRGGGKLKKRKMQLNIKNS